MNHSLLCTSTNFRASNRVLAQAMVEAMTELEPYWPMTVRQVFYQMVARQVVENSQGQYRRVSRVLVALREDEIVPWHAIEDRTRRTTGKRGWSNLQTWLANELAVFARPDYYGRCFVQGQEVYLEVATEKDALSTILERVLFEYCTRLNVVRGQVSATMVQHMSQRFDAAILRGQTPTMLYFGDLDASGVAIPKALCQNMRERHGVEIVLHRVALTPDQVADFKLPGDPESAKTRDPNYKAWLREYGPNQPMVELDALHPADLAAILRSAVESQYDMTAFDRERQQEMEDRRVLARIRQDAVAFLTTSYPEAFSLYGVMESEP